MDGTRNHHYAKQNKSDWERQVSSVLTYVESKSKKFLNKSCLFNLLGFAPWECYLTPLILRLLSITYVHMV
jgi:hypothetical protein